MKKIVCTVIIFAFLANVSAQLKVDEAGQVGIGTANPQYKLDITGNTRIVGGIYLGNDSNFIATTSNIPIKFKVNGVLAGSTGAYNVNVSFGYGALSVNTTGSHNTANGVLALLHNTTGYGNTANGSNSLYSNTTGGCNTANGVSALYDNITGSYNTAVGYYAMRNIANLNNTTAIGYDVSATSSNQVRIGNYCRVKYIRLLSIPAFSRLTVFLRFGINNTYR